MVGTQPLWLDRDGNWNLKVPVLSLSFLLFDEVQYIYLNITCVFQALFLGQG